MRAAVQVYGHLGVCGGHGCWDVDEVAEDLAGLFIAVVVRNNASGRVTAPVDPGPRGWRMIETPNYWATVNCGVYYASSGWVAAMDRSFEATVEQPNDELLWRSVLPADVLERKGFWWNGRVVHLEREEDIGLVGAGTYFAHGKALHLAQGPKPASCQRQTHRPILRNLPRNPVEIKS